MDDLKVQHVIFALIISASGGLVAALMMTFESTFSAWGFIRLVVLGMLIGLPLSFLLDDTRAAWLGEGKVAILFVAGFLAYPTFQALRRIGPVKIFWALVSKFAGMKPADEKER